MSSLYDIELDDGWEIHCYSPLEICNSIDGSFASGQAARILLEYLKEDQSIKDDVLQDLSRCKEIIEEINEIAERSFPSGSVEDINKDSSYLYRMYIPLIYPYANKKKLYDFVCTQIGDIGIIYMRFLQLIKDPKVLQVIVSSTDPLPPEKCKKFQVTQSTKIEYLGM